MNRRVPTFGWRRENAHSRPIYHSQRGLAYVSLYPDIICDATMKVMFYVVLPEKLGEIGYTADELPAELISQEAKTMQSQSCLLQI
jgi:hypothetical protein